MSKECWVCRQQHMSMHEHHVFMQARTQELGPLVTLCGSCHTDIHSIAKTRVSKLKGGKPKGLTEWPYNRVQGEQSRATALINGLVIVELRIDTTDLPKKTTLEIPAYMNRGLMMLKQDLGHSNKQQTILYCIEAVLKRKGLTP